MTVTNAVNQTSTNVNDQDFQLLLDIAYLALDNRMLTEAQTVLATLADARSSNPYPAIGLALLMYRQHRRSDAIEALRQVLSLFPAAVFTRSLLAMMLKEQGADDWSRYAHESVALCATGAGAELARSLFSQEYACPSQ